MKNYIFNNKVASFFAIILSVFFVVSVVHAATTISTNIQTDGTLSITATSTLMGNVGILTSSPLAPLQVGAYTANNSVNSQILVSRQVDDTVSGNGHAFSDSSNVNRSGTMGYNSYDGRITFSGSNNYDHYAAFQAAPTYGSAGTISNLYGLVNIPAINSGTVTNSYGLDVWNPTGAGTVVNNYGVHVASLTKGTNNWAVYTDGSTPSYFGGKTILAGDGSSNTGIGTTTPHAQLQIDWTNNFSDTFFAVTDQTVMATTSNNQLPSIWFNSFNNITGVYIKKVGGGTGDYLVIEDASKNPKFIVRSSGNVGINTSTPVANFQVANGTNATTTMEVGSTGQNKGSCLKLYRTDGSAIYAYVAAGATTFTLTTTACASVSNF